MRTVQPVPKGLAAVPPGPELACLLAGIDLTRVCNDDVVDVLRALSRQLAHDQARMFTALTEVVHRLPFAGPGEIRRAEHPERYGPDEVRAALAWTRRAAENETDLAYTLVTVLPMVHADLLSGHIDRPKAAVFARHLDDLTPVQIVAVCDAVLPHAPHLTTGQITDRIKRLVLELDPAYYGRRYRKAVRDRMVVAYLSPDGTAVISAGGLPADEAAAAWERLDALARAARKDGHPATLDQIRADLVLGLLDGTLHGLAREEILHALLERFAGHAENGGPTGTVVPVPTDDPVDVDQVTAPAAPSGGHLVGTEIRVPLSTLVGLDDRPGEFPGWGPVPAEAARRSVARHRRAQWRWVVVDDDAGALIAEGITRHRPPTLARDGARGGTVEIQVPVTLLTDLAGAAGDHGPWTGLISDIATQFGARRDRDPATADLDAHPGDRFPRAALRRHTEVRDRTCVHPGCRTPARRSDQDHTLDHHRGGTTTRDDLAPICRHDHMLKTDGGWSLRQPEPGRFVWRSPLGRTYRVEPETILPPSPAPVTRGPEDWFDDPARETDRDVNLGPRDRAPPDEDPTGRGWAPGPDDDVAPPF